MSMGIIIKEFTNKYLDDIRAINVGVSSHPNKPLEEKKLCQFLYIDYYAFNSTSNCFVAIDEDTDECVGYIISEPDLNRYKKIILNDYLPTAITLRSDFEQYLYNEVSLYESNINEYDAHLHMDVKPGHQHKGIGTMLIKHELNHLKQYGSKGVMLLCSASNINANNFYEKNGLTTFKEINGCNLRGIKL